MADQDLVRWGLHTVAVEPCGGRQGTSLSSTQCGETDSLRSTAPVSPNPPSRLPVPNPYPQFPWQTDAQHQHRQPQQPQPQQQQQQQPQHQRQLEQQFHEQRHPSSQQSLFQDRQHKERQHQSRWEQDRQQQQHRRRLQLHQQSAGDHDSTAFGTGGRGQAAPQSNWTTSQLNPTCGDILHRTGGALGASAGVVQGDSNPGPAGGSPLGMGTASMATFPRASSSISSDEALARALQEELMREPAAAVAAGTTQPLLPSRPLTAAVACSHLCNEAAAATRVNNAPHSNRPVPGGGHDDETLARELQEKYLRDAGVDPLVILAEGGPTASHPSSPSSSPSSPHALSFGTRASRGGAPGLSSSAEPPHIPPLSAPAPSPSLDVRWPEGTAGAPSASKAAAAKSLMTGGSFLCASADSWLNVGPELSEPRWPGEGSSCNSGSSGGCGSSGGGGNGEEEDKAVAMSIVMNELGLDCPSFSERSAEMRKRLARTPSIPHVMRVNVDPGPRAPIDDGREVESAHQILTRRLHQYGLREVPMIGDGNCQFRALADQLWGRSGQYAMVRKSVVKRLKTHSSHYSPYVPEKFSDYLKKMSKNGEWGDHITLQAAADHYRAKITLITSYKDSFLVELLPTHGRPVCELWISFYAEVHYNSVYPVEKFPQSRNSGKRVGWFFGLP